MRRFEWVLFDFDGTLVDSLDINLFAINKYGPQFFKAFKAIKANEVRKNGLRYYFKKYKIRKRYIPFFVFSFQLLTTKLYRQIEISENVCLTLRNLRSDGYRLGIISSLRKSIIKDCLKRSNLADFFTMIHTNPSLFSKEKVLGKVIKKYNISKDSVIYVGDEVRDINACKKIGIPIIAVEGGFASAERLKSSNPDYQISSFEDITSIIC